MLTLSDYKNCKGYSSNSTERVEISFNDLKTLVVEKIREACLRISLDNSDFKVIAEKTIKDYIEKAKPFCEGFVKDNELMENSLIKELFNSITSWGILTQFNEYAEYRELQINGPVIFVDTSEGYKLFRDKQTGKIIKFDTPEDCLNFIKNTLNFSGERLTEDRPLANALTVEGYRVSATHPSISAPHISEPTLKWPTATYRKIDGGYVTREIYVKYNTASEEQLIFLDIIFKGVVGMIVAGTTGCGKSTYVGLGIRQIPDRERIYHIGAPIEDNYRNMVDGIMTNNAVYFEVDTSANPKDTRSGTLDNLVSHGLRNTPKMYVITESRETNDFMAMVRAANAGSKMVTTTHTSDVPGVLDRIALELCKGMGIDMSMGRELACKYTPTISILDRIGDKTRKVMAQVEVVGYDRKNQEYIMNYITEFVIVDAGEEEPETGLAPIIGYFIKHNNPTSKLIRHCNKEGVSKKKLASFLDIPEHTVLKEVNFDKLPKDYVVEYDFGVNPLKSSLRRSKIREAANSIGYGL